MTKDTERAQVGWGFWLRWVLASIVGGVVGGVVGGAVGGAVAVVVGEVLMFAVGGAVFAGIIGIVQRHVLQRPIPEFGWWVEASTAGGALAGVLGGAVALVVDEAQIFAMVLAVGGALVGIAQWIVLRRQVAQAGWWVLASTAGGAVALVLGGSSGWDLIYAIILLPVALAGYGAITGGVMVWLLRRRVKEEPSPPQDAA